ncbi:MAG: glycoside hydrolase family 92 protein [Sphingobacteriales bacterium]|nr:MAG: glycoside hydrolase family 92 protein [Sphingobacteriales bacterium]
MKKTLVCLAFISSFSLTNYAQDFTKYVNPFIGTSAEGNTFPGATVPFGMVQLSPENNNYEWIYNAGYKFKDSTIIGFAHTHLSGTGCPDLGDILMLPYTTHIKNSATQYRTLIDKASEKASPGYYCVNLPTEAIKVELTATEHTGIQRYIFKNTGAANILLDLQSGIVWSKKDINNRVLESDIKIINNSTIEGYVKSSTWVEKKLFFVIKFSKPFIKSIVLDSTLHRKFSLSYQMQTGEFIETRVAISSVSIDGAKRNLIESENKSFETVKKEANTKWNSYLSKIIVDGNKDQKINFYTSMYHLFVQPNNIADIDGNYRGADDKIHLSKTKTYYSTLSIWDTYRAAHPLYSILTPKKDGEMVNTMLNHFDETGMLPIWTLWGKDNFCMIGNHAVPIITDAYFKGLLSNEDKKRAYLAIKQSLTKNSWRKYNWDVYNKYGYMPIDSNVNESVSRTLEAITDDWCAAQIAKEIGNQTDYLFFSNRANNYKNLYDKTTRLFRPKTVTGQWLTPFDPLKYSWGMKYDEYTEANAWQYFWHVQHDVNGLISLLGSKNNFKLKLDTLFSKAPDKKNAGLDISGMIGQYVHGNEPSHHIAYLYNYAGAYYKTQELIPKILKEKYQNKPDGLCGNDDCGQMSAWYIFSALGFYPVNPASGVFDIGVPSFKKAAIKVGNKTFTIEAPNLTVDNKYIQKILLNGKPVKNYQITYQNIMQGGVLKFDMGTKKLLLQ